MATKKVSYKNLLKQAISEFDTSKTVEVKGPMLDPILSWDGDGELPVYKDAASILERYYFNEDQDDHVTIDDLEEMEYNEDGTEAKTSAEKHGEGAGTEQAGTSDASTIRGMEKDQEKDIAKEMVDIFTEEEDADSDSEEDSEEEEMEEALAMFFAEQEDDEASAEDEDKDKELDVDKEMKDVKESGSPIGNPGTADEFEALEEAFDIFTEAMDDDDVAELDDDDIMV